MNETFWTDSSGALLFDDGNLYRCCRCPCVMGYAMVGVKTVPKTNGTLDYCNQSVEAFPAGISNDSQIQYSGDTVVVNTNAGLYRVAGTVETAQHKKTFHLLTEMFDCYDSFRDEVFRNHSPAPDHPFKVFDGTARPYHCRPSEDYGNLVSYEWNEAARVNLIPYSEIWWNKKQLNVSLHAWGKGDCNSWYTECFEWDEETGECIDEGDTWCQAYNNYVLVCNIDGNESYITFMFVDDDLDWERHGWNTTEKYLSELSNALSTANASIQTAKAKPLDDWSEGTPSKDDYNSLCSSNAFSSDQNCEYHPECNTLKTLRWEAGMLKLERQSDTPGDAAGVKALLRTRKRTGNESEGMTETVSTREIDLTYGQWTVLDLADSLPSAITAVSCPEDDMTAPDGRYGIAGFAECDEDCEIYDYKVELMDYIWS